MDAFLKKIERLAEIASRRADPGPLDSAGVMSRVLCLEIDDGVMSLPLGFFAGGAAAAAVVALVVSAAALAWSDLADPAVTIDSFTAIPTFMDVLL